MIIESAGVVAKLVAKKYYTPIKMLIIKEILSA